MKTILIASLGGSPQVITETLWALMNPNRLIEPKHRDRKPVAPAIVHMIGTGFVAEREAEVRKRIAALYQQCDHKPPIKTDIHFDIVTDETGAPLADIRTERENNIYSRHITTIVRRYANDDKFADCRIHMSLAGGRKTMSSYDQSAMMFFGGIDDELSHVLVEPASLESHPKFWWPGQPETVLTTKERLSDGTLSDKFIEISTDVETARIDLVPVPFVRLNARLEGDAPEEALDPEKLVHQIQSALDADNLNVDFANRTLSMGNETPVELSAQHFTMFAMLAFARRDSWAGVGPNGVGGNHFGWVARSDYLDPESPVVSFLDACYKSLLPTLSARNDVDSYPTTAIGQVVHSVKSRIADPFASPLTKMGTKIRAKLKNPHLLRLVLPDSRREGRDNIRRGLVLPSEKIRIVNVPQSVLDALPDSR